MARLRLFAAAAEAAGVREATVPGASVRAVLEAARQRFGPRFADVLDHCRIAVDGEPVDGDVAVGEDTEVAVLPPVAGGAADPQRWQRSQE